MTTVRSQPWHCPPKTIVAAVDFGEASARAVALAGFVASACGATLRALHAERFEAPPYFTMEQIARLESERRAAAVAVAAELGRFVRNVTACPVETAIVDEPPVDAILHAAEGADLVVLGTHGRRGPTRWWLGSVAERVVRGATVPVLVTRAGDTPPASIFERVVLVGDGGDPSPEARACAERLASVADGQVVLAGSVATCRAEEMARASLVVVATTRGRSSWGISDAVATALGACTRPVLFLPDAGKSGERQ